MKNKIKFLDNLDLYVEFKKRNKWTVRTFKKGQVASVKLKNDRNLIIDVSFCNGWVSPDVFWKDKFKILK